VRAFFGSGMPPSLATPGRLTTDPKLAHLDGLNLSRAWFARSRRVTGGRSAVGLADAATRHARDGLAHVLTGDYAGEHWLASFAVYLLATPTC
jgi:hypothetical protein